MSGSIQNRDVFLSRIANRLGREKNVSVIEKPVWNFSPQEEVLKNSSLDDLLEVLEKQCTRIHTEFVKTSSSNLSDTLHSVVMNYGGGPVIAWKDSRFEEYGLSGLFEEAWKTNSVQFQYWDYTKGEENIHLADKANVGITISDITLAESGTVVQLINKDKGRATSFLPAVLITLIPKSTLVPRITQAAKLLREQVINGEQVPSCINFITGPSNSADIELNLVVGVHGPVKAAYILIDDL